jgi:asparagine synthase (glutamine-hydrolysing)
MHKSIYRAARKDGCRVVLTGVGGDEWLSGTRFAAAEMISRGDITGVFSYVLSLKDGPGAGAAFRELMRFGFYPFVPPQIRRTVRRLSGYPEFHEPRRAILSARLQEKLDALKIEHIESGKADNKKSKSDFHGYHMGVLRAAYLVTAKETMELLSSLDGIELRAPLNSRRMIEFCFAVPQARRRWSGVDRSIHRSAVSGLVPEDVEKRSTKAAFDGIQRSYSSPVSQTSDWRRGVLKRGWASPQRLKMTLQDVQDDDPDFAPHSDLWEAYSCGLLANAL